MVLVVSKKIMQNTLKIFKNNKILRNLLDNIFAKLYNNHIKYKNERGIFMGETETKTQDQGKYSGMWEKSCGVEPNFFKKICEPIEDIKVIKSNGDLISKVFGKNDNKSNDKLKVVIKDSELTDARDVLTNFRNYVKNVEVTCKNSNTVTNVWKNFKKLFKEVAKSLAGRNDKNDYKRLSNIKLKFSSFAKKSNLIKEIKLSDESTKNEKNVKGFIVSLIILYRKVLYAYIVAKDKSMHGIALPKRVAGKEMSTVASGIGDGSEGESMSATAAPEEKEKAIKGKSGKMSVIINGINTICSQQSYAGYFKEVGRFIEELKACGTGNSYECLKWILNDAPNLNNTPNNKIGLVSNHVTAAYGKVTQLCKFLQKRGSRFRYNNGKSSFTCMIAMNASLRHASVIDVLKKLKNYLDDKRMSGVKPWINQPGSEANDTTTRQLSGYSSQNAATSNTPEYVKPVAQSHGGVPNRKPPQARPSGVSANFSEQNGSKNSIHPELPEPEKLCYKANTEYTDISDDLEKILKAVREIDQNAQIVYNKESKTIEQIKSTDKLLQELFLKFLEDKFNWEDLQEKEKNKIVPDGIYNKFYNLYYAVYPNSSQATK